MNTVSQWGETGDFMHLDGGAVMYVARGATTNGEASRAAIAVDEQLRPLAGALWMRTRRAAAGANRIGSER
jgi:hypothetical protein